MLSISFPHCVRLPLISHLLAEPMKDELRAADDNEVAIEQRLCFSYSFSI